MDSSKTRDGRVESRWYETNLKKKDVVLILQRELYLETINLPNKYSRKWVVNWIVGYEFASTECIFQWSIKYLTSSIHTKNPTCYN